MVVVTGDNKRHKDINHAAQRSNGGGSFLAVAVSSVNSTRKLGLGSRGLRVAHAAEQSTRRSLQACVEGTLAG